MKLILHIGQSKTGTSSIQTFLTRQRGTLLRQGFAYPSPVVAGMEVDLGSHNVVADALTDLLRYPRYTAEQYFSQFYERARKNNCHTMILSAEHFFGGEPRIWASNSLDEYRKGYRAKLERLSSLIAGHQVEIVVFLRPQVDWISSVTAQNITHGPLEGRPVGRYDDWEKFEGSRPLLTYSERLNAWREILAPQRFHVIPYVRRCLAEGNSVSEFLACSGINLPASAQQRFFEANSTISREYLEVKKRLNQKKRGKAEERAIIHCLRELSQGSRYGSTYRISEDVVQAIVNEVREDNDRISREYLNGQPFPAIGSYGDKSLPVIEPAEIDAAMGRFEAAFASPRYRAHQAKFAFLTFARSRLKPFHAVLHQLKRVRRWVVVRLSDR